MKDMVGTSLPCLSFMPCVEKRGISKVGKIPDSSSPGFPVAVIAILNLQEAPTGIPAF